MKTSVSVICCKWKILANGESPLMLRVAKDGKRTMKSLGISVNPIYWDFDRTYRPSSGKSYPMSAKRSTLSGVMPAMEKSTCSL
ncbi:MAG: hypothetical protein E7091_02190 [Bacteroidales bacterium]|nr:hypothetical protein [Bacteroidales bacterium]